MASLYNIQNNITWVTMEVATIIENATTKKEEGGMIHPKEVAQICLKALSILGYVSREISNQRKDNIRSSITEDLRALCFRHHFIILITQLITSMVH